jgi:hypothetical protein
MKSADPPFMFISRVTKSLFLATFLCIKSAFLIQAQTQNDISFVRLSAPLEKTKIIYKTSHNNKNEFELIFSGLFLTYKSVFSSQDIPGSCSFTPSCSEYGLLSIKKKGIFLGILNTFDRLERCNGMASKQYPVDDHTGKYIDNP